MGNKGNKGNTCVDKGKIMGIVLGSFSTMSFAISSTFLVYNMLIVRPARVYSFAVLGGGRVFDFLVTRDKGWPALLFSTWHGKIGENEHVSDKGREKQCAKGNLLKPHKTLANFKHQQAATE